MGQTEWGKGATLQEGELGWMGWDGMDGGGTGGQHESGHTFPQRVGDS